MNDKNVSVNSIEFYFRLLSDLSGDIDEHMEVIREYAYKSDTIVELGVRKMVSTWALLGGYPKKILCVDKLHPEKYGAALVLKDAINICEKEGIDFKFLEADDLAIELEEMDLLFIDTLHTYEQLSKELELHGKKAKKYIIMHDTEIPEMFKAIAEYIKRDNSWRILENRHNEYGLVVLGKKDVT